MLVLGVLSMTIRVFALQRSPIKATCSFSASLTLLEVSVWEDATICSTAAKSFCKTLARPWDSYPESFAGYVNVGSLTLALSKRCFPGLLVCETHNSQLNTRTMGWRFVSPDTFPSKNPNSQVVFLSSKEVSGSSEGDKITPIRCVNKWPA